MAQKRLALNTEGQMTYCSSSEENIGKGRCNHIAHQKDGESQIDFLNRTAENNPRHTTLKTSIYDFTDRHIMRIYLNSLPKEFNAQFSIKNLLSKSKSEEERLNTALENANNEYIETLSKFKFNEQDLKDIEKIKTIYNDVVIEAFAEVQKGNIGLKKDPGAENTELRQFIRRNAYPAAKQIMKNNEEIKHLTSEINKIDQEERDLWKELNELANGLDGYKGKNRESLMMNISETYDATYEKLDKSSTKRVLLVNKLEKIRS